MINKFSCLPMSLHFHLAFIVDVLTVSYNCPYLVVLITTHVFSSSRVTIIVVIDSVTLSPQPGPARRDQRLKLGDSGRSGWTSSHRPQSSPRIHYDEETLTNLTQWFSPTICQHGRELFPDFLAFLVRIWMCLHIVSVLSLSWQRWNYISIQTILQTLVSPRLYLYQSRLLRT